MPIQIAHPTGNRQSTTANPPTATSPLHITRFTTAPLHLSPDVPPHSASIANHQAKPPQASASHLSPLPHRRPPQRCDSSASPHPKTTNHHITVAPITAAPNAGHHTHLIQHHHATAPPHQIKTSKNLHRWRSTQDPYANNSKTQRPPSPTSHTAATQNHQSRRCPDHKTDLNPQDFHRLDPPAKRSQKNRKQHPTPPQAHIHKKRRSPPRHRRRHTATTPKRGCSTMPLSNNRASQGRHDRERLRPPCR